MVRIYIEYVQRQIPMFDKASDKWLKRSFHERANPYMTLLVFGAFLPMAPLFYTCLVWFGLVWFGLVWFGVVWFGLDLQRGNPAFFVGM